MSGLNAEPAPWRQPNPFAYRMLECICGLLVTRSEATGQDYTAEGEHVCPEKRQKRPEWQWFTPTALRPDLSAEYASAAPREPSPAPVAAPKAAETKPGPRRHLIEAPEA